MDSPNPTTAGDVRAIKIDYDRLDVSDIMDQIQKIAALAPDDEPRTEPAPGSAAGVVLPPGPGGIKGRIRGWMFKILVPFFPLIRFVGLPLHQDIRATQENLHETNKRLDKLGEILGRLEERTDRIERDLGTSKEYIRLLHNLSHNLVVELTKMKIESDTLKSKVRIVEKDQDYLQTRERALERKTLK